MRERHRAAALRLSAFDLQERERAPTPGAELQREAQARRAGRPFAVPVPATTWDRLRPRAKRGIDIMGSLLLLLFAAPIFLLIFLAARLEGGSAIYVHRRIGRDGVPFGCLKFRTMVPDADRVLAELLARDPAARAEWESTWKLRRDPRVTRRGALLRTTSLDELPQLINVLRGEMSLVGPRPVVREELDSLYGQAAPLYLSVRPGLTGLWQVSGRSDADYAGRVALDVAYVMNPSLRADLVILARTVVAVLLRRGAL